MLTKTLIDQVPGEKESLELHVDICQLRYTQLMDKFEAVNKHLADITVTLEEINSKVNSNDRGTLVTYLKWAGIIITTLTGVVLTLLLK